ncbi:MAG TPA: hypothetical protein QF646_07200, partial [Candidatus Poseidoniales archaeon]|nr:hypothetical protein [Candidatus Poseidoniales archaeon]
DVICFSDLHLRPDAEHRFLVPAMDGTLRFTPARDLLSEAPFDWTLETLTGQVIDSGKVGNIASIVLDGTQPLWLVSNGPLNAMFWRGAGGVDTPSPIDADVSEHGTRWTIPASPGDLRILVINDGWSNTRVTTSSSSQTRSGDLVTQFDLNLPTADSIAIEADRSSRVMLLWGNALEDNVAKRAGATIIEGIHGLAVSANHALPPVEGTLIIDNPNSFTVTSVIAGSGYTIPSTSSIRILWSGIGDTTMYSTEPVMVEYLATAEATATGSWRPSSLSHLGAQDTLSDSGTVFEAVTRTGGTDPTAPTDDDTTQFLTLAGYEAPLSPSVTLNASVPTFATDPDEFGTGHGVTSTGQSLRNLIMVGEDGTVSLHPWGLDRCTQVSERSSGWLRITLPWTASFDVTTNALAMTDSPHLPTGISVIVYSTVDEQRQATSSAWIIPLPALEYRFPSSNREHTIRSVGGVISTDHPEYDVRAMESPATRSGPGPRLSVAVPVVHPSTDSEQGTGLFDTVLTLEQRVVLVRDTVYEVRRGWFGQDARAIVTKEVTSLTSSEDWLVMPGSTEFLNDYSGWVPDPSTPYATETVYHVQGRAIIFGLQTTMISITLEDQR